jgi:hypothetical protein
VLHLNILPTKSFAGSLVDRALPSELAASNVTNLKRASSQHTTKSFAGSLADGPLPSELAASNVTNIKRASPKHTTKSSAGSLADGALPLELAASSAVIAAPWGVGESLQGPGAPGKMQ